MPRAVNRNNATNGQTGRATNRNQNGVNGRAANGESLRRQGNETMGQYLRRVGSSVIGGRSNGRPSSPNRVTNNNSKS